MDKLKKISKVMNVVFKLVLLYAVLQFIIRLVNLGTNQVALLLENPGADVVNLSSMDIGGDKWHFVKEQKMVTEYFIKGIVLEFLTATLDFTVNVFLLVTFGKILKPMMHGQPYDGTVSITLKKLGVACILISIAENVVSYLQAARTSGTLGDIVRLNFPAVVKGIELHFSIQLGNLFLGIMILVFSLVFRYGEALQVQADETL